MFSLKSLLSVLFLRPSAGNSKAEVYSLQVSSLPSKINRLFVEN